MKILDRTIIRHFFSNLVLWYLAICGIVIVSDLLSHFDEFFNNDATVNPLVAIGSYYFFFCLRLFDMMLIFIILLTALNILINMFRRNEMIALMALGIPPKRVIYPVLAAAIFCLIGASWLRESFVPKEMIRVCGKSDFFTRKSPQIDVIPTQDEWTRLKVDGESISVDGTRIVRPVFTLPTPWGRDPRVLRADEAVWCSARPGRGEGYLLRGIQNAESFFAEGAIDTAGNAQNPREPDADAQEAVADAPPISDHEVAATEPDETFDPNNILVYAPGEAPDTAPDEAFILCGVPPKFLAVGDEWLSYASTADLIAALRSMSLQKESDLLNQIHQRIVKPFSDIFPLLLALPTLFVLKDKKPYTRGLYAGLTALLYVGVCYFINFTCRGFLPSSLCAFLPMILFLPAVMILFKELDRC
ncbi:MAG: LptF/LptG family permease [Thermoguttaceae bacterium]|nr:LptF/LptG family permease [Thermoguttaceae bacterium]